MEYTTVLSSSGSTAVNTAIGSPVLKSSGMEILRTLCSNTGGLPVPSKIEMMVSTVVVLAGIPSSDICKNNVTVTLNLLNRVHMLGVTATNYCVYTTHSLKCMKNNQHNTIYQY